ncbi:ribbon-helix-helix domain-containing protein [Govanella unica]|uniref:Ribbon-helix-helix domain-containing protein n=1 Tax=Govanella unica TaxID=2975056 RepID=A0A9X3Z8R4_9PROT|nr:ribbon-helix-helix domain-containing protein [Govania unica]MDA5195094.1 ribbon-helix-helix domain-containing protein [Govania unica]
MSERPAIRPTDMKKHSVTVAGHRTSISLEAAFWDALQTIARTRGVSINRLIADIDEARSSNLSSAIRVFVLEQRALLGPVQF